MDVRYQRSKPRLHVPVNLLAQHGGHTPANVPLALKSMRKTTHGFLFLSYMSMGLRLAALLAAGAPL